MAIAAPMATRLLKTRTGWVLSAVPLSIFVYLVSLNPQIKVDKPITRTIEWVPSLGINLDFYLDSLAMMMALLVSGIGALVFIYAQGYLEDDADLGKFFIYLSIFMAAMLGLVLSGNLITLFIFWEITSISSYLLIGYKHKYGASRDAALQALIITGGGGLALMAGLVVLGQMAGGYGFETVLTADVHDHPLYALALILILFGAFTKSAQVPFHTWLPGAMAAPTPVSAYLHSATMVKAGIYLLARLNPVLGHTDLWFNIVTPVGATTMLIGAWLSWQNHDLKKILAYSTISVLGTLTMMLGMGEDHYAVEGLVIFLLAHAFYKGCLFMVAGAIDHSAGTRDIRELSGLRGEMPILFGATVLATLSKAGIPLLLGFIGKELLYEATLHTRGQFVFILTLLAVVSNAMVGASAALVAIKPFLGKETKPHHIHKPNWGLQVGPIVLAALSLLFGLLPGLLDGFGGYVASNIAAEELHPHFLIWHGTKSLTYLSPLYLSIMTVALAFVIYRIRPMLLNPFLPLRGDNFGPQRWFHWFLDGTRKVAEVSTSILQNGNLRYYLMTITTGLIVISGGTLLTQGATLNLSIDLSTIPPHEFIVCVIIVLSAVFATRFESRLAAIAALGGVGFGVSALFMLLGAPDLAMTQISIEILSVVLIAVIMGRLPYFLTDNSMTDQTTTTLIAGTIGVFVTVMVLLATEAATPSLLTPYFSESSYKLAEGRNVVNVILVDFRGLDTLGEITVLAIAGMGVFVLSRLRQMNKREDD